MCRTSSKHIKTHSVPFLHATRFCFCFRCYFIMFASFFGFDNVCEDDVGCVFGLKRWQGEGVNAQLRQGSHTHTHKLSKKQKSKNE